MYRNAIKETIFEASNYCTFRLTALKLCFCCMYHLYHVLVQYAVHKSAIGKIKFNWPVESKLWFCFSNIFKKSYLNNNKHNKTVTLNFFCWFCNLYARIVIQKVKWNFDRRQKDRNMETQILCLFH